MDTEVTTEIDDERMGVYVEPDALVGVTITAITPGITDEACDCLDLTLANGRVFRIEASGDKLFVWRVESAHFSR
jgi:hypothetical protein